MPQVNIPTMQDARHLLEETPLPSKTYGPSSSADGLGTYKTTCPTRISSLNTISETTFPVLLVEFSDVKFLEISTPDKISRQLNEENYSDTDYKVGATSYSSTGSVRDYFLSQSSGLFSPHFVVVGKVALPRHKPIISKIQATTAMSIPMPSSTTPSVRLRRRALISAPTPLMTIPTSMAQKPEACPCWPSFVPATARPA